MSRVISHLKKDISTLTRYHPDASNRLCFILGARNAIFLMNSVRDAPENLFLLLNTTPKVSSLEDVKKRVEKEIKVQGYSYEIREDFSDVITVQTSDRKKIYEEEKTDGGTGENKFDLDQSKLRELSTVIVKRDASIVASMGGSIYSSDIIQMSNIESKEEVVIQNMHYDIVGYGIAEMSAEEIERSPGRIAIRTFEGRYDIFRYLDQKRYKNGLYSVSTLPRILGKEVLKFKKNQKANILVVCQDDGEIAVALQKKASPGSKLSILIHNEEHKERVLATLERLQAEKENITFIEKSLTSYSKSRPRNKFTHCFVEFRSSNSGMRPNPFFELEENEMINLARAQFQGVRALALICENEAQIAYVSHSLDPTENQEIIVQNFRQGNFSPLILPQDLLDEYPSKLYVIPEIPTMGHGGKIDYKKMKAEEVYTSCWLTIDAIKHKSHAGFVAYFEYLQRRSSTKKRRI